MEKYYIALYELGIKNELLCKVMTEYKSRDIICLFEGKTNVFLTDMEWLPYKELFDDKKKIANALDSADSILNVNKKNKIKTAFYSQKGYPKQLMEILNPPAIIYYKGVNPEEQFEKSISCVGTRELTHFGLNAINYLIPQWVNEGFSIISGLARGVDRFSHIACLAAKGKTMAVLAHGLDMIYPKSNKNLSEKILACNGTLLSEYPVGTKPDKFRFVNRNRLIAALSKVTVAMEFKEKGGSMHTIEFARQQGHPIFCPDPGMNIEESQTGLKYIIDKYIGRKIKNGVDYKGVITAAGYKIEKPTMSVRYIKEQYVRSLIMSIEDDYIIDIIFEKIGAKYKPNLNITNCLLDFVHNTEYCIDDIINIVIEIIQENKMI